ncbi:MAG: hypothetical protein QF893_17220 [Alphaproteobacteria bacterium]|jgi:hypothetical protein|nr:hypothetical protein [Alphaproteobacteria bacterium]
MTEMETPILTLEHRHREARSAAAIQDDQTRGVDWTRHLGFLDCRARYRSLAMTRRSLAPSERNLL